MGIHIHYKEKYLGKISSGPTVPNKDVFVAESLDTLKELFTIPPTEEVEVEGARKMPFQRFYDEFLKSISSFYPTEDAFLVRRERESKLAEL